MVNKVKNFSDQDYETLKKDLLKTGELFTDPSFPPNSTSLTYKDDAPSDIEWKRPKEIQSDPKLMVDGASARDFSQGELGNCWFVATCAAIAEEPKLWKKVVPDLQKQEFGDDYAGIFHFHFYRLGEWVDVVVDDYLPTRDGALIYVSSPSENEFWSALLEKAYAKMFGDYESLTAGKARDAMVDLLGGVAEGIDMAEYKNDPQKKETLLEIMAEAHENHSLMSVSIAVNNEAEMESKTDTGLIKGHAYSVINVKTIKLGEGLKAFFKNDHIQLVCLRNPWGGKEWTGPWSDSSPEWQKVSDKEKKEMGVEVKDDGEFWMSFADFCQHFTSMDVCHIINQSVFSFSKTWKESIQVGQWVKPKRCGGCPNHDTFLDNPQYLIDIENVEEEILISLEQEDQRTFKEKGIENKTIGFAIMKADLNRKYRHHHKQDVIEQSAFCASRSIFLRLKLKRGRYCIIPSTFEPGVEGRFFLRTYSGKDVKLRELTEDGPTGSGCCGPKYKSATTIHMYNATGLEKQDIRGGADPYYIIEYGGEKVKSPFIEDTRNPEWNSRSTFYKKNKGGDIKIEIWNHNTIRDELMGAITIMTASTNINKKGQQKFRMTGIKKEANTFKPGQVILEIINFADVNDA